MGVRDSRCPKCTQAVTGEDEHQLVLSCRSCTSLFLRAPDEVAPGAEEADDELLLTDDFVAHYQILQVLGAGGAGRVYRARDLKSGRDVAIKLMLAVSDPQVARRFEREGQLLAQVDDKHVVRLLDTGYLPAGTPYLVSEFVPGGTLRTRIRQGGPIPMREAIGYVLDLLRGLDALHRAGVTHRDIKPENILLDGHVAKIADLGLARHEEVGDAKLTATGAILGTPRYMSPEQAKGSPATHLADIYAAGVVLYEVLTGKTPFQATSYFELMRAHVEQRPHEIREIVPNAPLALEVLVSRALSKNAADRPQSAKEMASELERIAHEIDRGVRTRYLMGAAIVAGALWIASTVDWQAGRAEKLRNQAVTLYEQGKPEEALVRLAEARALLRPTAAEELASVAMYEGRALAKLGDVEPARAKFEEARQVLEKLSGPDAAALADVWADLGGLALVAGKPAEAVAPFERAVAIRAKRGDAKLADAQVSLGTTLLQAGDAKRAEPLLREALAALDKRPGAGLARCLNAVARLETSQGRDREALEHYNRALKLYSKELAGDPEVASVLSNTGGVYTKLGDHDAALGLYLQALAVLEKKGLRKQVLGAQLLLNIGNAHLGKLRAAEAVPVLEEAVATLRSTLASDHPAIAQGLTILGRAYASRKMGQKAEECLGGAVSILEKAYPSAHPDLLQAIGALAYLRVTDGRAAQAEPLVARLVALEKTALTPAHATFVNQLGELASVFESKGLPGPASSLYIKGAEYAWQLFGPGDAHTALATANAARAVDALGRKQEAEIAYKAALHAWRKGGSKADAPVVPALRGYVELLRAAKRDGEALQVAGELGL